MYQRVPRRKPSWFCIRGNSRKQNTEIESKDFILFRKKSSSTADGKVSPGIAGTQACMIRRERNNNSNESTRPRPCMDTLLSHAGLPVSSSSDIDIKSENEPLAPPLHLESTYTRPASGDYFNVKDGGNGWVYSRVGNPTRKLLEDTIKDLELINPSLGVVDSQLATTCAFSSGMAAVSAVILALPQPLHIFLADDIYHGVPTQLKGVFLQRGVTYSNIDMTSTDCIREEIDSTEIENVVVWMESPSNPRCKVTDVKAVCELVDDVRHRRNLNITTIVDSTWSPPNLTQPLLLGADAVLHSGTKYLGGHSDVLIGIVTTSPYTVTGQELGSEIRKVQTTVGSTASPFDCWLTLRGLRTLHLRVERQCETAMELALFLEKHPLVERVHYPGLSSHKQHEIASRQMVGAYGGMLSFEMKNEAMAMAVAGGCTVIKRATSLGGTETLIEHRASIEPEDGKVSPDGLLRLSVGLESASDLKQDLDVALKIAQEVIG